MEILDYFIAQASKLSHNIGIGLGENVEINQRIMNVILKIIQHNSPALSGKICLIGTPEAIQQIKNNSSQKLTGMELIDTNDPYQFLIENYLFSLPVQILNSNTIFLDAIIRGGLSSARFLKEIKENRKKIASKLSEQEFPILTTRIALLETANHHQFFFAPVGIDEANTFKDKKVLVENTIHFFQKLKITPKIAILSGGRMGDIGRDSWIDQTIHEAEQLVPLIQKLYPDVFIKHYQITIEEAIQDRVNFILAPEGIAGNLIYRTLVHLGNGKSYGAIYLTHFNYLGKIIIDTSRVAPEFEIEGAIYLALGMNYS